KNILDCNLSLAASMDLETDQSGLWDCRIGFGIVHGLMSVDEELDSAVFCMDLIVVPVILPYPTQHLRRIGCDQRFVSPRLVVETGPVSFAPVGLIAGHLIVRVDQPLGMKLDSRVDKALFSG